MVSKVERELPLFRQMYPDWRFTITGDVLLTIAGRSGVDSYNRFIGLRMLLECASPISDVLTKECGHVERMLKIIGNQRIAKGV